MSTLILTIIFIIGCGVFLFADSWQQRQRDRARQEQIETGHIVCPLHWSK